MPKLPRTQEDRLNVVRFAVKHMISSLDMPHRAKIFSGYQPTQHDVFVANFGKSGTNWMMQIAQQITHKGASEFDHIHDVVAWPEGPPGHNFAPLSGPKPYEQSPTGLRVIKTHLNHEFLPYHDKATYLTIIRDPKEVLVSSYFFLGGLFGLLDHVSIDDWYDLSYESIAKGWAGHTAGCWNYRDRPNVLILNYRELKKDLSASIEQVAATMRVKLTEAQLAKVFERSSFAYMKTHASKFRTLPLPHRKQAECPPMIRRGQTGGTEKLLSQTQLSTFDHLCQVELQRLGSDFPYKSFFDVF